MRVTSLDVGWDSSSLDVGDFPYEITREEIASAARRAYMRLVIGATEGWGKVELARWLVGPYRRLAVRDERASDPPPSTGDPSGDRVAGILDRMRMDVMLVMHELMSAEGRSAFEMMAFDSELVSRTPEGVTVALTRPRMTLTDRVLSLVAIDLIERPEDFEHSLFVCDRCRQPVFDVAARPLSICRIHVSGVVATR